MEPVQAKDEVADNEEPFEPCPTPLSWQDVLRTFREQSQQWDATIGDQHVSGQAIGQGPPLYFLNGLTGDSKLFSLTAWLLRDDYRCILYDYPTSAPFSEITLSTLLTGIADELGHDTFSMFSVGAGCMTALSVLQTNAHRVDKVILQGGFARCQLSLAERVAAAVGKWCPGTLGSVPGARKILQQNHRPWFPPFDHSRWSFAEENLATTPVALLSRMTGLLKKFDCEDHLGSIETPVMLVRCEGDSPIQVQAQDQLEGAIPNVEVQWLHTCGRLPFLTHPHRLKRIVADFLAGGS